MVAQQQLRQVDMNRLALACVTVVKLAAVEFDDIAGTTLDLDGDAFDEHEMMTCSLVGAVVDGDDGKVAVAWLGNYKYFLMKMFELFDHL